jgi:hypothetical protein
MAKHCEKRRFAEQAGGAADGSGEKRGMTVFSSLTAHRFRTPPLTVSRCLSPLHSWGATVGVRSRVPCKPGGHRVV